MKTMEVMDILKEYEENGTHSGSIFINTDIENVEILQLCMEGDSIINIICLDDDFFETDFQYEGEELTKIINQCYQIEAYQQYLNQ